MEHKTRTKALSWLLTLALVLSLIPAMALTAYAQIDYGRGMINAEASDETLTSDITCTKFLMSGNNRTLTVNKGVTLTLQISGEDFSNFSEITSNPGKIELHGIMTGSCGGNVVAGTLNINVYLSDGAKYAVSGLPVNNFTYYGYDAATDGHGTVSVKNGSTDVTSESTGSGSTTYTFTATPANGYKFVNWTKGAGGDVLGTDASINVTCEQNRQYQVYANFEADTPAHTHSFSYSATGATITATCSAEDKETSCPLKDNNYQATLTIAAPTSGGGAAVVTVTPTGAIAAPTVKYQAKQNNGEWGTETTSAPGASSDAAFYKASITLGEGDSAKTAYVTYGVNAITKGTVTGEGCDFTVPAVATANATVTISTSPATGYELKTLTVKKADNAEVSVTKNGNNGSFTMPEENVTVSAEFQKINYTISLDPNMSNGTVTASKGGQPVSAENPANYQDEITLTAVPDTGFTLKSLSYKPGEGEAVSVTGEGNTRTFTMPASNVTVSATFEGLPFNITTVLDPTIGGTVSVTGNGVTTNDGTKAKAGTEVTLTVTPNTGFDLVSGSVTVTKASGETVNVTDNKFTMPTEAVTVTATFEGRPTTASLNVTGDKGPNCTAKLLDESYNEIESVSKKAGDKFILLVNRDEGYDFNVTYGTDSPVTLTGFTEDEYREYIAYAEENNVALSSGMILAWATMPGVAEDSVTLTATFSPLQTFTVLYQPNDTTTTAAWCKFAYTEAGNTVTASARMNDDAAMGDGAKVYSLKVTAAFNPAKVTFAATEDAVNDVATDSMTSCSAKTSAAESDWTSIAGSGKYVVIGGNAKTVIAAFVTDENAIAFFNSKRGGIPDSYDGVTYRLAVVANGNPGTVTAPSAPENDDESIEFAGWSALVGTAPNTYDAGASVSITENTSFNATWKPKELTVTLNPNGGTGGSDDQTVTYNNPLPNLEAPTRDGFAFDGWTVNNTVTEDGQLFVKGTPFVDPNTKITADMGLNAQWKHVHSYTCYRVTSFDYLKDYYDYDSAVHVAICGCNDIRLEAHAFDSSGACSCGYGKPAPGPVNLDISYGQWDTSSDTYITRFKGLPQPMNPKQGEEVTISAPYLWEDRDFLKWQYSTDGTNWYDLAAAEEVSFIIPCDMKVRALYVNTVTTPQVELSASIYEQDVVVKGETKKADNILYQMNYKLPDGYTFVDAGVRLGDNDGIVYYELKERTHEPRIVGKVAMWAGATFLSIFTGGPEIPGTKATETYYEVCKSNAVADIGAAKVAKYMYENEPVSAKAAPILYESKATTKGMSGSVAALTPLLLAQAEDQNNWIYGIGWLRYQKPDGTIETIYTDALAATLNNMPTNSVTKTGN